MTPLLGSLRVVHVDGNQQTYFWNDGTATASATATTRGGQGHARAPPPTNQPTLPCEFYEYVAASKTDYDQCYDYDPKCVEVDMGICGGPTPEPTNCRTTPCTRCCSAGPRLFLGRALGLAHAAAPTRRMPSQTAPIAVSMQNPSFDGAAYDSVRLA